MAGSPDQVEINLAEISLRSVRALTTDAAAILSQELHRLQGREMMPPDFWPDYLEDPTLENRRFHEVPLHVAPAVMEDYNGLQVTRTTAFKGNRFLGGPQNRPQVLEGVEIGVKHADEEHTIALINDGRALLDGRVITSVPLVGVLEPERRLRKLRENAVEGITIVQFAPVALKTAQPRIWEPASEGIRRVASDMRQAFDVSALAMQQGVALLVPRRSQSTRA